MKKMFKMSMFLLLVMVFAFASMVNASGNSPVELKKLQPVIYNDAQIEQNKLKDKEVTIQAYYEYEVIVPYIVGPDKIGHKVIKKKKVVGTINAVIVSDGYIVANDQPIPTYIDGHTVQYELQFYNQLDINSYSPTELVAFNQRVKYAIFKYDPALTPTAYQQP